MKVIPKDAVLAVIDKFKHEGNIPYDRGLFELVCDIESDINSLEGKEVDLDFQTFANEMDSIYALPSSKTKNTEEEPLNWEYAIAKHFFELGLRASLTEEKYIGNVKGSYTTTTEFKT